MSNCRTVLDKNICFDSAWIDTLAKWLPRGLHQIPVAASKMSPLSPFAHVLKRLEGSLRVTIIYGDENLILFEDLSLNKTLQEAKQLKSSNPSNRIAHLKSQFSRIWAARNGIVVESSKCVSPLLNDCLQYNRVKFYARLVLSRKKGAFCLSFHTNSLT